MATHVCPQLTQPRESAVWLPALWLLELAIWCWTTEWPRPVKWAGSTLAPARRFALLSTTVVSLLLIAALPVVSFPWVSANLHTNKLKRGKGNHMKSEIHLCVCEEISGRDCLAMCPNNQAPYQLSGVTQYCTVTSICPSGYSCVSSSADGTVGLCCPSSSGESDTHCLRRIPYASDNVVILVLCQGGLLPFQYNTMYYSCTASNTLICPTGFSCQLFGGLNGLCCPQAVFGKRKRSLANETLIAQWSH